MARQKSQQKARSFPRNAVIIARGTRNGYGVIKNERNRVRVFEMKRGDEEILSREDIPLIANQDEAFEYMDEFEEEFVLIPARVAQFMFTKNGRRLRFAKKIENFTGLLFEL